MTQRIIYQTEDGGVAIIIPTGDLSIEEVARKDVPVGVPYQIVDVADIPTDRTFRNAWEAEITTPDGTGENYGAGSDWGVVEYHEGTPTKLKNAITGEEVLTALGRELEIELQAKEALEAISAETQAAIEQIGATE